MAAEKNRVLHALAAEYAGRQAARTGQASRDLLIDYQDLLEAASCERGEERVCAERDLDDADAQNLLKIERHPRTNIPLRVRFHPADEVRLFEKLSLVPPSHKRELFAGLFLEAATFQVPARWQSHWAQFCSSSGARAAAGQSVPPFSREKPDEAREVLYLLPRLLAWKNESLRRFASCQLCASSKRLEKLQTNLEKCLTDITEGKISSLEDLGILENERAVILHGPLQLHLPDGILDIGLLNAPCRIDRRDLRRSTIGSPATRCITVENLSVLHELAKKRTGAILASSGSEGGFAHSAIIDFLRALPDHITCWHAGDTDPKGFEILLNLRERTGRAIHSFGMTFDGSISGPPLDNAHRKTLLRLLASPLLTDFEKSQLLAMQSAGHQGAFEQESRPLPDAANCG
ncbi:MAG: Wadjet anti-phage system protein JetD domain-containing protein [Terrimicrobiaceae bacterium]